MNQSERYKVNRKRTLQAILRAFRPDRAYLTDYEIHNRCFAPITLIGFFRDIVGKKTNRPRIKKYACRKLPAYLYNDLKDF